MLWYPYLYNIGWQPCVSKIVTTTLRAIIHIDNIETQVETAAVRVEGGNKQLEKAVRHKVRGHLFLHYRACYPSTCYHKHVCVCGAGRGSVYSHTCTCDCLNNGHDHVHCLKLITSVLPFQQTLCLDTHTHLHFRMDGTLILLLLGVLPWGCVTCLC